MLIFRKYLQIKYRIPTPNFITNSPYLIHRKDILNKITKHHKSFVIISEEVGTKL